MSDQARWRRTWWAPGGTEESLGRNHFVKPRLANAAQPMLDHVHKERVLYGPDGERLIVQQVNPIGFRCREDEEVA